MPSIEVLSPETVNQIAAGEVVERPAHLVKELIENSLDSGSTSVGIFIKSAGKQLIHIIDNGNGMSREDLELSIKRHATSKIMTSSITNEIPSITVATAVAPA